MALISENGLRQGFCNKIILTSDKLMREAQANIMSKKSKQALQKIKPAEIESTPLKFWKDEEGKTNITSDSNLRPMDAMKQITGTKDAEIAENVFYSGATAIASVVRKTENAPDNMDKCFNIIAQNLNDFQPQDAIEAQLIAQSTALYQHGMARLAKVGNSTQIDHSAAQVNMAVKLLRLRNETIETLHRYRRRGEQRVTVTHAVVAGQAIVNNHFPGVGVPPKKQGDTPCPQENAEQKQEHAKINLVPSQPWLMEDVDSMVDDLLAPRRNGGEDE
jgi:hypothetical protein